MTADDGGVVTNDEDVTLATDTQTRATTAPRVVPVRFDSPALRLVSLAIWGGMMLGIGHLPTAAWLIGWVAFFGWASLLGRLAKRIKKRELVATADTIRVGKTVVPKKQIQTATPMRDGGGHYVRLVRSLGRRIDIMVSSEKEAADVLHQLGLDAESSACSFPVHPAKSSKRLLALLPFGVAAFFWMGGSTMVGSSYFPLGAFLLAIAFAARQRAMRISLVVGTDGVQATSLMKSAFYKHSAISRVEAFGAEVSIHLRGGEVLGYKVTQQKKPKADDIELARRIWERIMAARHAAESATTDLASTTSLGRGGRSPREWLEFLRRVGDGAEASFRKASVSRDALLRTLENPAARSLDRLTAMVSLAKNLGTEEAVRVRVAIDACAEKKLATRLRVALEDPSADALEHALLEAEADAERETAPALTKSAL